MTEFITTQERAEIERQQSEQRERERAEQLREQNNATALAEQNKRQQAGWEKQNALEAEAEAANKAKNLQRQIGFTKQEAEGLRREYSTERELVEIRDEAAGLVATLAARPLADTLNNPRDLDRLARLRLLVELWPERKKILAANVTATEQKVKALEAEFVETQTLFQRAQAAVAKLLKRDGGAA